VKLSELNMPVVCRELLHPLGKIRKLIKIVFHDAALLVEESYDESEFVKGV